MNGFVTYTKSLLEPVAKFVVEPTQHPVVKAVVIGLATVTPILLALVVVL